MVLYHGSNVIVQEPKIIKARYNKDFYFGFYCTKSREQAERWAIRFGDGYINIFEYTESPNLSKKIFPEMSEEWLDFIASCRNGNPHNFDMVEGPMADDKIYNYVQGFLDGKYSREQFWSLAKFEHPTHQISFHTEAALKTLKFLEGVKVYAKE